MNDHSRSRDGISYPGICVRIWKMAKLWIIVATVLGVVTEAYGNVTAGYDCSATRNFGRNCSLSCNCLDGCHGNGKCQQCSEGWAGPTCQIKMANVALNQPATQGPSGGTGGPASFAVDGDVTTWAHAFVKAFDTMVWWGVDLGTLQNIVNVVVVYKAAEPGNTYHRTLKRRRGHAVWMSNASDPQQFEGQRCYHDNGQGEVNETLHTKCSGLARYVRVYTSRNNSLNNTIFSKYPNLELVEVTVTADKGCSIGSNGDQCEEQCGHCEAKVCSRSDGHCAPCLPGWTGDKCFTDCPDGSYGDQCNRQCGHCEAKACSRVDGHCAPCLPGWSGDKCLIELCVNCADGVDDTGGCQPGWYGDNCNQSCIGNCFNNTCIMDTGLCSSCPIGYTGSDCSETCPDNCDDTGCEIDGTCKACDNGYHGNLCDENCSSACNGCLQNNGTCKECDNGFHGNLCNENCSSACNGCFQNNGSCVFCQAGFYGVNCETPCSDTCDNKECDKEGHCIACADKHFYGNKCDIACSSSFTNCEECTAVDGNILCLNCSGAKFGQQCDNECPDNCELCASSKHCTKCAMGFSGAICNCNIPKCLECDENGHCKMCEAGLYGQQCDKPCPDCKTCKAGATKSSPAICLTCNDGTFLNDTVCLSCPNTCTKCNSFADCPECKPNYYGKDCVNICPINCLSDSTGQFVCDGQTGTCWGDCKDGFYGDYCNLTCIGNCGYSSGRQGCNKQSGECFTCRDGYYGQFCDQECGPNCDSTSGKNMCERDTGDCSSCKPKFFDSKCEEHCNPACEDFCDQETGKCDVCISNRYGQFCTRECNENCGPLPKSTKVVCNQLNAECLYCKVGFHGERCTHYCENNCARSENSPNCEKSDGRCKGCSDGFYGEFCKSTCDYCKDKICDQNTGHCKSGCKTGWFNQTCTERCSSTCKGEECDQLTGVCLAGCVEGYGGQFCKSAKPVKAGISAFPIIIGVAVPVILILLAVVIFLIIRYHRKSSQASAGYRGRGVPLGNMHMNGRAENGERHALLQPNGSTVVNALPLPKKKTKTTSLSDDDLLEQDMTDAVVPCSTDPSDYYNLSWPVPVADFPAYVRDKRAQCPTWYREDFSNLPKGLLKKCNVAMEIANKGKCRYKQLYPYDDSRVKLDPDGNITSDFINASYVNGYKNPQGFIAAQGPTDVNVADFWRMIYQKDCGKVVMLTNLFEECKMKCVRYWPDFDEMQEYGNLEVRMISENVFPDYTLRNLKAVHKVTHEEKDFLHFHFTAWPDRGVPDNPSCMLNFRAKVMEEYSVPDGPILVHCSAGIGRTGTFVALDFLLRRAAVETHIDVFRTVTDMRYQRTNFVQTDVQYDFLHKAIAEALQTREMEVSASEFCKHYWSLLEVNPESGNTKLQEQFELLNQLSPEMSPSSFQAGCHEENLHKNRFPDVMPVDMYRAYLSTPTRGSNEYINAVFLPTALNKTGFLLTQMPLPHTVTDFWRLVFDHHVNTIVMMNNIDDNDESIGEYWPSDDCTYGPFKVELMSCENFEDYSTMTIKLSYNSTSRQSTMVVKQYRFESWPSGDLVPPSTFALTALIGAETMASNNHSENPTIVHCMNGAERSGLYCVLSTIFEKLQGDQKINIPQTILQWRNRRPQIIPNLEQYDFCYKAVSEYLDSQQIYSNVL